MYTEIMEFFGLKQPLVCNNYYETEQRKNLYKELKVLIQSGGIYALTGMVGSGKTTLLNRIQAELEQENKIIVSKSLSTEKNKLSVSTIYLALFYDLTKNDKNFKIPTQGEKRERQLISLIKKNKKPVSFFIDEAHDVNRQTLTSLKRIVELATFNGCQLSIILAGHPKLTNMLALSSNEEIGARTKAFSIDQVMGSMEHYIEWLLKHNLVEKVKINEIIHPDAIKELATALITPLQIHKYLLAAMEIAYIAGIKPITKEVITKSLAPDLDSIEARLARSGYSFSAICELLNAPAQEVRNFLLGKAHSSRKSEFLNIIRSIHITV